MSVLGLGNEIHSTVFCIRFSPLENKTIHAATFVISDQRINKTFDVRGTTQIKIKQTQIT